ncbi:MAG TPA: DUF4337 domain-containing protein [Acidobacteriaceae bacterium]|nr:DUF4337 domain-containing protein [Acidobacteriaceae bacterium]
MEPNEARELQEQHEEAAANRRMHPVSFTMSVLAVMVAIVTVLGHRTHTEAVLSQARATDEWNLYQAHKIRQYDTQLITDLLSTLPIRDQAAANKITDSYKSHVQKWNEDLTETQNRAKEMQGEVLRSERRADRFDLAEALLEIGLVVTSITLLAGQRAYWYMGLCFGIAGVITAALAYAVH